MLSNKALRNQFTLFAELLHLHNQDERLADYLSGAAFRIRRIDESILNMNAEELKQHFRPDIVALLRELKSQGTIAKLEELIQLTPPGLFDMMRIKGLAGKKLSMIWKAAKIDSIEELLKACKTNRLSEIPGFGVKTEQNIIAAIEDLNRAAKHFLYADVADSAHDTVALLRKQLKNKNVSLCGDIRRQSTTISAIEILTDSLPSALNSSVRKALHIQEQVENLTKAHTRDEIPVIIYHCGKSDYALELFKRTGNERHIQKVFSKLDSQKKISSESALYKRAGLPYIPPELREDVAEWEYAKNQRELITPEDIKGVVHNHTTWSDGVDDLEEFVRACAKKKFEYVVISDHSQNAHYAGGLKPEKVLRQFQEIDRLNKLMAPFKIFKSIECDILVSGELDYDKSLLSQFDLVIISIHQLLKMNEEKATSRLIRAIENPYTTVLGHMTGRQLLIRPGYPVDFKKVIDACAANHVVIEINANPYRLDMDWSHIPYAIDKGVMISINPDAHSIHEIDNIRWGVCMARKGGLTKEMTWNAMQLPGIQNWLKQKMNQRSN